MIKSRDEAMQKFIERYDSDVLRKKKLKAIESIGYLQCLRDLEIIGKEEFLHRLALLQLLVDYVLFDKED